MTDLKARLRQPAGSLLQEPRWEDLHELATTANCGVALAITSAKATVVLGPRLNDLGEPLELLASYTVLCLTSRVVGRPEPRCGLMQRCCAVAPHRI
jgi:hypothetical protein